MYICHKRKYREARIEYGNDTESILLWSVKCGICKVMCDGLKCYEDHLAGKKHRRIAEVPVVAAEEEPTTIIILSATTSTPPAVVEAVPTAVSTRLEPNPFSGRVPELCRWHDCGSGLRPVIEGSGCGKACHICAVEEMTRSDRASHSKSEGSDEHLFESERQESWMHYCTVCVKYCSGFISFRDHVAGRQHRNKVKLLGLEKSGYCLGRPYCRLECCR